MTGVQTCALPISLTGLPNRATLQTEIDLAIRRAERHGYLVAILFVDIDRFKVINDTLGHSVGDKLLSQIGSRLHAGLRQEDIVTRHGGDEFVLLLKGTDADKRRQQSGGQGSG